MKQVWLTLAGCFLLAVMISFRPLSQIYEERSEKAKTQAAIDASPGFTHGLADEFIPIQSVKGPKLFKVRYQYKVKDVSYLVVSEPMGQGEAEQAYLAKKTEVVYDTHNPASAELKKYYEIRHSKQAIDGQ